MRTQLTSKERGIIYRTRNTDPRGLRKDSKHWRLVAGTRSHCCLHTALPTVQAGRAHHCKTAGAAKSYCCNCLVHEMGFTPCVNLCHGRDHREGRWENSQKGLFQKAWGKTSGNRLSVGSWGWIHSNKRSQEGLVEKIEEPFPPQFW